MNNIAVKVDLLKGSAGTGIDKTIPQNGVIYYDGSTVPEGYEETADPTGGGSSAYNETTLWSGEEYAANTELNLSESIATFNQVILSVKRTAQGFADQYTCFTFPVSGLVGTVCGLFGYTSNYLYIEATSNTKFTIKAGLNNAYTIVSIIGVKY